MQRLSSKSSARPLLAALVMAVPCSLGCQFERTGETDPLRAQPEAASVAGAGATVLDGLGPHSGELAPDWATMSNLAFEATVATLAAGAPAAWDSGALDSLAEALGKSGMTATRAAIMLAYDPGPAATEHLLKGLEQRHQAPSRGEDAGDIVAAAALRNRALDEGQVDRLGALVFGSEPHPDLEVRVACAATAFQLGGTPEAGAFLVRILRTETPGELLDPGDWGRVRNLAWVKSRSAQALNHGLGMDLEFRADGSWAHQMETAEAYERALNGR